MDVTECTGTVFYNPVKYDIYEFQTTIQHKEYVGEEGFTVNSKEGAEFTVNPIINYSVIPDSVVSVFQTYKKELIELESSFIKTAVYDAFRIATNSYTADSLIGNRQTYELLVRNILDKELGKAGFRMAQFTSNLTYPPAFKKSIELKNAMVQQAQTAENKVRLAQANAEIAIANQSGVSRSQIIAAEADAKITVMNARADAEAAKLRLTYISPLYNQYIVATTWNGALPVYGTTPQLFKGIGQ
jgi:regulator of protease activity HflC (stomatin/prohibitin superfamily)